MTVAGIKRKLDAADERESHSVHKKRRSSCISVDSDFAESDLSLPKTKWWHAVHSRDAGYHSRGATCHIDERSRRHARRCHCHGRSDSGCDTAAHSTRARRRRSERKRGGDARMDSDSHPSALAPNRHRTDDDKEGHLIYKDGDILHSRYELGRLLGQGTFGKVVDCKDLERDGKRCVVKIVRKMRDYYDLAKLEVDILEKLNLLDPNSESRCVRMLDWFDYHGHLCIVFDRLGLSVYEFLKRNCYRPFTTEQVQQISYQLCHAIKFCHDNQLVHTDLKPENVLFVDSSFELSDDPTARAARTRCGNYRNLRSTDVQVIDFGSATFEDDEHGKTVGTRQYRAPEVVLELDWSYPSDVWSIGCIIFELYTGRTLFETHDNLEHLAIMERILGPLPHSLIAKTRRCKFFKDGVLDWNSCSSVGRNLSRRFKPIQSYIRDGSTKERQLLDLVSQMLRYKPSERITLVDALQHPFFNGVNSASTTDSLRHRHHRRHEGRSHSRSSH